MTVHTKDQVRSGRILHFIDNMVVSRVIRYRLVLPSRKRMCTGSANDQFLIVGNQLRTAARFNFEARSTYSVRIRVTDRAGLEFSKPLTVAVLDRP